MKTVAALILIALLTTPAVAQQPKPRFTAEDARNLVLTALPEKTKRLPKFELDEYKRQDTPEFYFFQALWGRCSKRAVSWLGIMRWIRLRGMCGTL